VRFHYRHNRLKGFAATGSRDAERGDFPHVFSASGVLGMVSRALNLATVTLLIGCLAAGAAHAQATNLEAGKSPSQIFAGTCNACHKSPRGLLKTVPASSLPGYLRQHYTTSSDMASVLSSYLVSNGATDTRYQAKQERESRARTPSRSPSRRLASQRVHPIISTASAVACGRPRQHRKQASLKSSRQPSRTPTGWRCKARAVVRAATQSGWRGPAKRRMLRRIPNWAPSRS
jgi:hypothetical protein